MNPKVLEVPGRISGDAPSHGGGGAFPERKTRLEDRAELGAIADERIGREQRRRSA